LLLRETSLEAHESNQPASAKPAICKSKSKRKRNLEKRLHKRARMVEEGAAKAPKKSGGEAASREKVRRAIRDLPHNPETRGGGAAKEEHSKGDPPATPLPTSGRECSA
jgi:hypothetical protein